MTPTRLQDVTLAERLIGEIRGAVARGWCSPENQHKEMDATLALAIADEVARLWQSEAAAALSGEVVAWRCEWDADEWLQYHDETDPLPETWDDKPDRIIPLYASPQPQEGG